MFSTSVKMITPSDPKDYTQPTIIRADKEYFDIKFGDTFYIIDSPVYAVDPKTRKATTRFQKFKLVKGEASNG